MAEVEVWKGKDFETPHERKALESIIQAFKTSKSIHSEKVFILSNFILRDREILHCQSSHGGSADIRG